MEISKLFASIGFKLNEADVQRVDQKISDIQQKLKSLSGTIKVKIDPSIASVSKIRSELEQALSGINVRVRSARDNTERGTGPDSDRIVPRRSDRGQTRDITRRPGRSVSRTTPDLPAEPRDSSPQLIPLSSEIKKLSKSINRLSNALRTDTRRGRESISPTRERSPIGRRDRSDAPSRGRRDTPASRQSRPDPEAQRAQRSASNAQRTFGQRQQTVANTFREIGLSTTVTTSRLRNLLGTIGTLNRSADNFNNVQFQVRGFSNALSQVSADIRARVSSIMQSGDSQSSQLRQLRQLSSQLETQIGSTFRAANAANVSVLDAAAVRAAMSQTRAVDPVSLRAASADRLRLDETIQRRETEAQSLGGFRSERQRAQLLEAIESRRIQLLRQSSIEARSLASQEASEREGAARRINRINQDITRLSNIEARARTRVILDTNQQASRSFRQMARTAFNSFNSIRNMAQVATGAMAGFVGITGFVEANRTLEQLNSAFLAITGNAADAKMMMDFVNKSSDSLGLSFKDVAQASKSFAAATQAQGVSIADTQEMLTGVFEAARTLGLSSEDTQGAVRAMSQMFGKVNVSAEELRQQLGERIPNAIPLAAKAMYGTAEATDQLFAAMQRGELKAKDLLPKLSKEFREFAKAGLPSARKSIGAEIERFKNAMFGLFTGMGEDGGLGIAIDGIVILRNLIEGLTPLISKVTMIISAGLKLITVPLKLITGALKIIKSVDLVFQKITNSMLSMVGASEGVKKLVSDVVDLSTVLAGLGILAVAKKFGILARVMATVSLTFRAVTVALAGTTAATAGATRATNIFTAASVRLRAVWMGIAGSMAFVIAKIAAAVGIGALVAEEIAAVGDTTKTGLLEIGANSDSVLAKILRGPIAILSAFSFAVRQAFDTFFGTIFGDMDQVRWNFREGLKDFFDLKDIDPTLGMSELWDLFWDKMLEKAAADGPVMGVISIMVVNLGKAIGSVIDLFLAPFNYLIDLVKGTLEDGLSSAVEAAGENMMNTFKDNVTDPLIGAWNSLVDAIGAESLKVGAKLDVAANDSTLVDAPEAETEEKGFFSRMFGGLFGSKDSTEVNPIPKRSLEDFTLPHLDTINRLKTNPSSQINTTKVVGGDTTNNVTLNQTINAQPGQSEQEIARIAARESQRMFNNNLVNTAANAPVTE